MKNNRDRENNEGKRINDCIIYRDYTESINGFVMVRVYLKKDKYNIKIFIKKSEINAKNINSYNSMFSLDLNLYCIKCLNKRGSFIVEIPNLKYREKDIGKTIKDVKPITIKFKKSNCCGSITIQPQMFIPENWNEEVVLKSQKKAENSFLTQQRSKMNITENERTNYSNNNITRPFQGGSCSGK